MEAGQSCTFSVTLQVPAGAAVGDYPSATSNMSATVDGSVVVLTPAVDILTVHNPLSISKSFIDDPVLPGDTVTLEFTLTNLDQNNSITDINFTDDLDANLSGLVATVLPAD